MFEWISRFMRPEKSHRRKNGPRKQSGNTRRFAPYRAVTIVNQINPCEAAERVKDHMFLAAHAPTLPLGSCSHAHTCECKYKHHTDRRGSEVRRDADIGLPDRPIQHDDRRNRRRDRRQQQERLSKVS
ncbi:MAG: hypothetical protein AAF513_14815 [Pseudomonadota bacterium]